MYSNWIHLLQNMLLYIFFETRWLPIQKVRMNGFAFVSLERFNDTLIINLINSVLYIKLWIK